MLGPMLAMLAVASVSTAVAALGALLVWRGLRGDHLDHRRRCARCGYPLAEAGRVAPCTECGADLRRLGAMAWGPRCPRTSMVALGALLLEGVAFGLVAAVVVARGDPAPAQAARAPARCVARWPAPAPAPPATLAATAGRPVIPRAPAPGAGADAVTRDRGWAPEPLTGYHPAPPAEPPAAQRDAASAVVEVPIDLDDFYAGCAATLTWRSRPAEPWSVVDPVKPAAAGALSAGRIDLPLVWSGELSLGAARGQARPRLPDAGPVYAPLRYRLQARRPRMYEPPLRLEQPLESSAVRR